MSRRCDLTGVQVQFGNNVSHSQRKTRRNFKPNLRKVKYRSDITGQEYTFKVVAKSIRTIEKLGGFDNFMIKVKADLMSCTAKSVRKKILKKQQEKVSA